MSKVRDGNDEAKKAEEQPGFLTQLQAILNVLPAYAWYTAPSGALTFVNKRSADYLGLPKDHPLRLGIDIGAPWDAHIPLLHPDDQEESRKAWSTCLRTGEAAEFSQRVPDAEGRYRWFLSRAEPLRASDGTLLQWVGVNLDIDELKCAEEGLRESEYKLRQIIETVPGLLWSAGPDGEITHLNQRILDYSGMRLEDFKHGGWEAFLHPDDFPETEKAFRHAIQTGTSYEVVHRLRRLDGEYRWHHVRGEPLRDRQGHVVQWYGLSIDIEERKQAEDLLRRSEAHLAEAQRLSHTGAVAYNGTAILYASEETYRIWGFDPAQGVPSREAVFQRIHPGDRDRLDAEVRRAVGERRGFSVGYRIVLPDGTVKHLDTIGQPVFSASGELVEIVATQTDVTERKRAEERLRVQHTVAQILAEAATIEEATPRILLAIGECLGWDVGALWRVDRDAQALRCVELWHEASIKVPEFERVSRAFTFGRGSGLPGRVWSSREPEYIADVVPDENFPRAPIAEREGLRGAFSFPILLGGEVLGVIEFFSREIRQPDQELLNVLATIGSQIGQFIERKRGEEELRESEQKFRDYAETASDWFWETDPHHKFTRLTEDERRLARGFATVSRIGVPRWEFATDVQSEPEKWELHRSMLEARKPFRDFVYRATRSDGSVVYNKISGKPVFDANGEFRGYRGTGTDVTAIVHAQEALRESERNARSAIDGIAGLLAIMAPNGELDAINRQTIEYFGRSLEEMKNWGTSDAVHPEDLPRIAEVFVRSIEAGTPFHYEVRLRRFDGAYRWFDNRCVPIRETSGRVVRWYLLGTDIEERKRAEEGMRESETKFRDYAETASDWFWEIDADYKFTMLTENAFGSDAGRRIGTLSSDYALDRETEPEKWRLLRERLDNREPFRDFVYHAPRGDGTPIHVKTSGKPVFDADGEFRGYRGTGTDVTAIVHAQEALRESEQRSRSAIDGIAGLVAILAPNGELETVNRQCLEYFGRPLEWLKNWGTNDTMHLPDAIELVQRSIASGVPYNFENRLRRFDGEYRWFDSRGVPVRDESGRIARFYILMTDIEDRKRALARLDQMQSDFAHMNRVSMLGEMAASLSHEIAQPIASTRNNARAAMRFLDRTPSDLGEVREALACVVEDADRARDIIDRIRDHIKKAPPRKSRFDLNKAIDEVIGLARSAVTTNGVSVRTRLAEGLFSVEGDRVQLQQVVLNLILNAVEAMSTVEAGPRELLISTEQPPAGGAIVSVHDSGPGIDQHHLDRVFQAFYTTKSNGVGMGLSICRSIIDAHGGRLWAELNASRGAVFRFTLPDASKDVTTSRRSAHLTGELHEDTA